jgi:hypothetical protein
MRRHSTPNSAASKPFCAHGDGASGKMRPAMDASSLTSSSISRPAAEAAPGGVAAAAPGSEPGPEPGAAARATAGIALWPLALLASLLPCAAALLAWGIATQQGLIPACFPFTDGCTSISRAGRHGLANHVFRSLMMPAAVLQAITWVLVAAWLGAAMRQSNLPRRGLRLVAPLGLVAGVALITYSSFLGVDGPAYRFLRQYGTVLYFGLTCINMLLAGGALQRLHAAGSLTLPSWQRYALPGLSVALVSLGLGNAIVAAAFGAAVKDRIENVTEWWGALIFVLAFAALAWLWWREGLRWQVLSGAAPRNPPPR